MKRFLALGLSLALMLCLGACQTASPNTGAESAQSDVSAPAEESTSVSAAQDPADQSQPAQEEASASAAPAPIEEPEAEVQRGPRTFGLSMPEHATLAQTAVAEALQRRLEAMGDALVVAEAAGDAESQIAQLNALAGQKVSAVFLCPVDGAALEETVTALSQQNLPVFGFGDWDFTPEGMVSLVLSDEYNAGYVCGINLADRCPNGGDVLVLERTNSNAMMERAQGFMEAAEESGVELEVADEIEVQEHSEDTEQLVRSALKENPKVVGIFAASDQDAELLLKVTADSGCLVYSGDGSPAMKAELGKNTNLGGLGAQSPAGIAEVLEESANQYLDGEAVEEQQTVGTFLITEKNVEKYGVEDWQ